jgi:predicted MFS family arabinose efflux permease
VPASSPCPPRCSPAFLFLCSKSRGFTQMLLCRVGVGAGDAGFGPPVASLLGDHYPERRRASALTVVWLGAPLGALSGSVLGGWIAQHADWRLWFVGLSVPSALAALLAFFTLKEPRRGLHDPVAPQGRPPSMWQVVKFMLAKRSMVQVLIGASLAATAMNGIGQFLGRYYTAVFHLSLFESGRLIGIVAVVAMASGLSLGGFGVSYLSARDRRWYVWAPAIALAATTPLFVLALTRATLQQTVWLLLAGHITLFVYFTPTLALAQNMVGASMRASSSFVIYIVFGLVGVGLGPTLIGRLSDLLARHAFGAGGFDALCPGGAAAPGAGTSLALSCGAASGTGIMQAIGLFSVLFAWAAVHFLLAARHLEQDLDQHYVSGDRVNRHSAEAHLGGPAAPLDAGMTASDRGTCAPLCHMRPWQRRALTASGLGSVTGMSVQIPSRHRGSGRRAPRSARPPAQPRPHNNAQDRQRSLRLTCL